MAVILTDDMTLEEKLEAIDLAMAQTTLERREAERTGDLDLIVTDPAELFSCGGCQ